MSPTSTTERVTATKRQALIRGLSKFCPHCGEGPLFKKGTVLHERCSACDLQFQLNPGDSWAFLVFVDRAAVIFPIIVAIYFDFFRFGLPLFLVFTTMLAGAFILTTPNRYGFCVALDYLTRIRWGDESDILPELPNTKRFQ